MVTTQSIPSARPGMASVPLAMAYVGVPLTTLTANCMGMAALSPFLPWLMLAGLGAILALHRPSVHGPRAKGFAFKATLFMLLITGLVLYSRDIILATEQLLPYLKEGAPLVILLFSLLWAATCGTSDRTAFQRFGALLGLFCMVDLAVEATIFHTAPTLRYIGNADVLAGLLLVALCASLKPGGNDGGIVEPDQGNRWYRALILLGLMAALSRTGLFAAAWLVLCFGRGQLRWRIPLALAFLALLLISFTLPPTSSEAMRYANYWLWIESLRIVAADPSLLLTGMPLDQSLPVHFTPPMIPVWEAATGMPASMGVGLEQVGSFWLRLILGWGIACPLVILAVLFFLLFRRLTRMGAGLTTALFAQGMTTPLIFDPTLGAAVFIGFIVAMPPSPKPPAPEPDPTREWNLRAS